MAASIQGEPLTGAGLTVVFRREHPTIPKKYVTMTASALEECPLCRDVEPKNRRPLSKTLTSSDGGSVQVWLHKMQCGDCKGSYDVEELRALPTGPAAAAAATAAGSTGWVVPVPRVRKPRGPPPQAPAGTVMSGDEESNSLTLTYDLRSRPTVYTCPRCAAATDHKDPTGGPVRFLGSRDDWWRRYDQQYSADLECDACSTRFTIKFTAPEPTKVVRRETDCFDNVCPHCGADRDYASYRNESFQDYSTIWTEDHRVRFACKQGWTLVNYHEIWA